MDPATAPPVPVPQLDVGGIARLRDVLAGGHLALEPDRQLAKAILGRHPWADDLIPDANAFHIRAAVWAAKGGTPDFRIRPAAGLIFAASGYPIGPYGFHEAASLAAPGALFAYAALDDGAVAYNTALLSPVPPLALRPAAYQASARDPADLLGAPEARAITKRGPAMVQLQLCAQWWPPEFAAWAIARYAKLLPSGSTLALSLAVPAGGDGGDLFLTDIGRAGGTLYPHTADDVARWIQAAKLKLVPPGVTDTRGRELGWAAAEFGRQRPVARVIKAVALVP